MLVSPFSREINVGKALAIIFFIIFVPCCSQALEIKEWPNTGVLMYSDFGPSSRAGCSERSEPHRSRNQT